MIHTSPRRRTWLAAALVAAFIPGLTLADNDKKLKLLVKPDGPGQYRLEFADTECPTRWNEKKGCVYQNKGNKGKITWRLDRAYVENGWKLDRLYFGTREKESGVEGFELMECLVNDFDFDPNDAATGLVSSAKKTGGGKLELKNETTCDEEYYIFYRLVAVRGNDEAESDPIISNGGRPDRSQ